MSCILYSWTHPSLLSDCHAAALRHAIPLALYHDGTLSTDALSSIFEPGSAEQHCHVSDHLPTLSQAQLGQSCIGHWPLPSAWRRQAAEQFKARHAATLGYKHALASCPCHGHIHPKIFHIASFSSHFTNKIGLNTGSGHTLRHAIICFPSLHLQCWTLCILKQRSQ